MKAAEDRAESKAERWRRVAVEAVKQCGRGIIPEVRTPVTFEAMLGMVKDFDVCIMPYEELGRNGVRDFKRVLKDAGEASAIGIIVGPEGGFSPAEAEAAAMNGVRLAGLGERIMRTETVGGSLLSMIAYEYEY